MKRGIAGFGVGVADRADNPGLAGVGIAILRRQRGKSKTGPIVGSWIEVWIARRVFQFCLRIKLHVPERDVVHVVRGHMTAGAKKVQQRARTRNLVLALADVEGRGALALVGERIVGGLCSAVGGVGRVTFSVGGSGPRQ